MLITSFKTYWYSVIFIFGLSTIAIAQNDADPAITSFGFKDSSVPVGETTTLSLFFLNNGNNQDLEAGSIAIVVSLTNSGEYAAEPESELAVVSGHPADMFTWTYNASTKSLRGVLNTAVTPGDGGQIDITVKGLVAGSNTSVVNTQRLQPADLTGDNVANNTLPPALLTVAPALPVTLVSFQAVKESKTVNLSWSTTEETNASHFEIQRSADAKNWNVIGKKDATGESKSTITYSFSDSAPLSGTNYYRLKMVDNNETFAYSRIQNVQFTASSQSAFVYPNPSSGIVNLGGVDLTKIVAVEVADLTGKVVSRYNAPVSHEEINLKSLKAGLFILKVNYMDGSHNTHKVVITK